MTKAIAVIGAGPAGLVSAKTLLQAGFDVTVFEMGSQIGGTWVYENDNGRARLYRNLHINTAKEYTRFSDFTFAPDVPAFPSHWDMHRYLRAYADHFGVTPRIAFRREVTAVRPAFRPGVEPPSWQVETRPGDSRRFDAVAVCTSPFAAPRHATEIRNSFKGTYLHAADYREPAALVGRRVCVIGGGNSAVDIASDVCATATRTVLVARSGVFITPQLVFGRSFNELVVSYLQHWWVPSALRRCIVKAIVLAVHGRVADLGFKPPPHRVHPTTSATIVADIAFGRVVVKQGIARIEGRNIHFTDGTAGEFDVVIAATGYEVDFPFVPSEVVAVKDARLDLYQRMIVPHWPGLYFIGMINLDTPINYACERQARFMREIECGRATLPSRDEMWAAINAKHRWVEAHYGTAHRHAMQEESLVYYAELERAMGPGRGWLRDLLARWRDAPGRAWRAWARDGPLDTARDALSTGSISNDNSQKRGESP